MTQEAFAICGRSRAILTLISLGKSWESRPKRLSVYSLYRTKTVTRPINMECSIPDFNPARKDSNVSSKELRISISQ